VTGHDDTETFMVGFLVDERPHIFVNDAGANRRFLEGIDRHYWAYQAMVHGEQLESDDAGRRQHAAAALRVVYSQGLETMFAFIAALVQSPRFPIGWLARYTNADLRSVVRKIHEERAFPCALKEHPSWTAVANLVFGLIAEPTRTELVEHFPRFWYRLANRFLEERFEPEYNNLKHGLRAHVSGFGISVGIQDSPDVPAPRERMQSIGGSEYGSTFWLPRKIDGRRFTFELSRLVSCAWAPGQFAAALPLIGMTINDVAARALLVADADSTKTEFVWPADADAYEAPWRDFPSISHFDTTHHTDLGDWIEPSAEEVRGVYGDADAEKPAADPQPRDDDGRDDGDAPAQ